MTERPVYEIDRMQLPWFEGPFLEPLLREANVTDEEAQLVRDFATNGYMILDGLGLEDFDALADRAVRDLAPSYDDDTPRIVNAWQNQADVKAIATAPRVLELLRLLYQRGPIPFQTLNFAVGTEQALHSDMIHFDSIPRRFMCGVWVALEDVDENCGPLMYVPGSHRLPDYHYTEIGLPAEDDAYQHYVRFLDLLCEHQGLTAVTQPLRRGQALVWAANLLHGGSAIKQPGRTRHSQVTHYYFEDCAWYIPRLSQHPGRLRFREVLDIRSGDLVTPKYGGWPIDLDQVEWVWRYPADGSLPES